MTPKPRSVTGGNPEPERESDTVRVDTDAANEDAVTAAEAVPVKKPVKRATRRRPPASASSDDVEAVQDTQVVEAVPVKKPVKRATRRRPPASASSDDVEAVQDTQVVEAVPVKKPVKRATRRRPPASASSDDVEAVQSTEVVDATPEETPQDSAVVDQDAEDIGEDGAGTEPASASGGSANAKHTFSFARLFAFGVLPFLVLLLGGAAGYLKWQSSSMRDSQISGVESVAAAKDATVAMLSYQPDTVEKDLGGARDRLTGTFKDSYTQLTHDMVIPGAKQKHISAVATVPAAASVKANANHAVVLVFVNQTVVVGTDPPSATASVVRVTLDKVRDRWLISGFDPV